MIDVINTAAVISAGTIILSAILTVYKFYDSTKRRIESQNKELKKIKQENSLLCYALAACLDGLQQLGANHSVPVAKEKLNKYLNKAAHDEN